MSAQRQFLVTLIEPDGTEHDITPNTVGDAANVTLNETAEETLSEIAHDDVDLELSDPDGELHALLRDADPDDEWRVRLERETARGAPEWEIIFVGIIDLTQGVKRRRADRLIRIQAHALTKLLERGEADQIKRTFVAMAGSATSGTNEAELSAYDDIFTGDKLQLDNGTNVEELTIASVEPGVKVTLTTNWAHSYSNATAKITTPFYRYKPPQFLTDALFEASGIEENEVDLDDDISDVPFATPVSLDGFTYPTESVRCLYQTGDDLVAGMSASPQRNAASPQSGWVAGDATTDGFGDWRPYYAFGASEPASIASKAGATDDGTYAWDHDTGDVYGTQVSGSYPNLSLRVTKNGSSFLLLESGQKVITSISLDFYPGVGVLVSWFQIENGTNTVRTFLSQVSTSAVRTDIRTSEHGWLRTCVPLGCVLFLKTGELEVLKLVGGSWVSDSTMPLDWSSSRIWTARALRTSTQDYLFTAYVLNGMTRFRMWKWPFNASDTPIDYQLVSGYTGTAFGTLFTDSTGRDLGIVWAGSVMVVLARYFAGVVEYADFTDLSCAAAIKEIALMCGTYVTVDVHGVGRMQPRIVLSPDPNARVLDDGGSAPLDLEEQSIFGDYRASVEVKYTDLDGNAASPAKAGATAKSASRLSLSPKMAMTASMALAMASASFAWVGRKRGELKGTWDSPEGFLKPLDQAIFEGTHYRVLAARTRVKRDEQELRLVEIVEAA